MDFKPLCVLLDNKRKWFINPDGSEVWFADWIEENSWPAEKFTKVRSKEYVGSFDVDDF